MEFYSFLPLTVVILLTAFFWRVDAPLRLVWVGIGVVTALCSLMDWILLERLPKLGLSFGPVHPPHFMLNFIRLMALLLAFFLLSLASQSWQRWLLLAVVSLFQITFLAAAYQGLYFEPFRLTVSNISLDAPAFLPDRSLRILQLSDLHVEHITARERAILDRTRALAPDIIVLTGDFLNKSYIYDSTSRLETREWLSQLSAPYGVYAVNGNLDKPGVIPALFDGLSNVRILDNEIAPIALPGGTLYLVGAMTVHHSRDYETVDALLDLLPSDSFSVLIHHYPERVDTASRHNVDLMLVGDTHGGQIRLPFIGKALTINFWHKYVMGKFLVGPTTLYVSRGLGMQGGIWPRMRLNCPPEMVLVTLGK